jgi:hypothetical protein
MQYVTRISKFQSGLCTELQISLNFCTSKMWRIEKLPYFGTDFLAVQKLTEPKFVIPNS